ncbi:MAG: hypothetical protein RM338_29050 [Nostoc sp. DedQUE12a]|nr:hypothetical protein [Nostoc sp. DedQUE12a]
MVTYKVRWLLTVNCQQSTRKNVQVKSKGSLVAAYENDLIKNDKRVIRQMIATHPWVKTRFIASLQVGYLSHYFFWYYPSTSFI